MARNFAKVQFNRMLATTAISAVITFILGVADTVFAGHLFGKEALAGVNLMSPVISLVAFVASTVAFGATIKRSCAVGQCNRREMDSCCSTGLWAALVAGLVLGLLFFFADAYFSLLGVGGIARDMAKAYCGGYWAVAALTPLFFLVSGLVCGDGGHRPCRIALIANITLKVGLSIPLSKWLGLAGLPWATVIGMVVSLCVLTSFFRSKTCTLRFQGGFSLRTFLSGVRYSISDEFYLFGEVIKMLVVNKFVVMRFGEDYLPIVAAFSAVSMLTFVASATANALQPVMGVYLGEKNYRRVRDVMRYGLGVTAAIGLVSALAILAFPQVVTLFIGLKDPNLLPHAYVAVRIAAVFLVFLLISNYMDSYVLYAGKFGMSLCMVAFESCIVPIACGVGLGFVFNMCGFWFGLALAPLVVLTVVLSYMFKRFGNPYMMPSGRDANIFVFDLELTAKKIAEVSEKVMRVLEQRGLYSGPAVRAPLIAEEALMIVMERNKGKRILSEVTLDLNDGVGLTLRDDGEIFDLTDSDANVSSLRSYLVANVMANQSSKFNLVTTGFNRNGFRFESFSVD